MEPVSPWREFSGLSYPREVAPSAAQDCNVLGPSRSDYDATTVFTAVELLSNRSGAPVMRVRFFL